MKKDIKKSMMPATVAPVQRKTSATVSCDGNATAMIAPSFNAHYIDPFVGNDAE